MFALPERPRQSALLLGLAALLALGQPAPALARDPASERRAAAELGRAWRATFGLLRRQFRVPRRAAFPQSAVAQAEAFRHLAGLALFGLERALHFNDPDWPAFQSTPDPRARWGQENPDVRYLSAPVRGDGRYRITGRLGSAHHLIIQVVEGDSFRDAGTVVSSLTLPDLAAGPDGSFEIAVGAGSPPGDNVLSLTPGATRITIREIFYDWAVEEPGRYRIVRVGSEGLAPPPPIPEQVAAAVAEAGKLAADQAAHWAAFADTLRSALPPNLLLPPQGAVGAPDATLFGGGHFRLGPGEGLLIESTVPDALYWSYSLGSPDFATVDYANRQSSVNGAQAHIDSDGRFRAVISVEDPGVPNWLDPAGHGEGFVIYRYTEAATSPIPTARIVRLAELRNFLPPDHPVTTPAERRAAIAIRQAHVSRRLGS